MEVVGRFLYGSQNYGLDNEDSDKDYKVLCMPNMKELFFAAPTWSPPSTTLLNEGWPPNHNVVQDVRNFMQQLNKCNPNAMELLFSTEAMVHPDYNEWLCTLRQAFNEGYVLYNVRNYTNALSGMTFNANLDTPKGLSRARYFVTLLSRLVASDFCMTEDTWAADLFAYSVRYNEAPYSEERVRADFGDVIVKAWRKADELVQKNAANKALTKFLDAREMLYELYKKGN